MKLALALMFGASLGTLAIATPAAAQGEDTTYELYANSGYTYCDAKLMGALYGQDPFQGKLIIGQKIANGIGDNITLILEESRSKGNRCDWADLPHTYDDAEALARAWGVPVEAAKVKAAAYYTDGMPDVVSGALGYPQDDSEGWDGSNVEVFAFGTSGFTYCDAKLIGAFFNQTPYEGKIFIGGKITAGLIENVPWYLDRARKGGTACEWADLPYSYDDAVRLSSMWNKSVEDTKSAIAQLATWGRADIVDTSLGRNLP
jgi:hypothetical protein